jgi:hypothetical protein
MPVGIKALLEREEMFAPIIANQAACNRVSASFDPTISEAR